MVHDVNKSMEAMWNTFGICPWRIVIVDADSLRDTTSYGKLARFGFKAAITQNRLGGIRLELIAPLEGDSIYRDFLREHGEGVQHLGWHKVYSLEVFAETTRKLEKAGFPCTMSGRTVVGVFAYMDTRKVLNTFLELAWADPLNNKLTSASLCLPQIKLADTIYPD